VKRAELGELYFRQQVAGKAAVTEEEAKKYFSENTARIQTDLHVFQILWTKEDASVEQAKKDLDGGARFEDVARRHYPTATPDQSPWDLGYMKWSQIPDAWRKSIEAMKPGEVSGVIHGPKNRVWILKLIERRVNPEVSFDSVKAPLIENLTAVKIDAVREQSERELKDKAKIVYSANPVAAPSGQPQE
jgi:peptidyl-prolyl cis-trans isomerase C